MGNGKNTDPPPVNLLMRLSGLGVSYVIFPMSGVLAAFDLDLPELESPGATNQDISTSDANDERFSRRFCQVFR